MMAKRSRRRASEPATLSTGVDNSKSDLNALGNTKSMYDCSLQCVYACEYKLHHRQRFRITYKLNI